MSAGSLAPSRPLIKLHVLWKKDGVLLSGGISDFNRRLTIPNPTGSDTGYYECEAVLRSSSVPSVIRGAYLSVLGETGQGRWRSPEGASPEGGSTQWLCQKEHGSYSFPWSFLLQNRLSLSRSQRGTSRQRWRERWIFPVEPKVTRRAAWTKGGKDPETFCFSWPNRGLF